MGKGDDPNCALVLPAFEELAMAAEQPPVKAILYRAGTLVKPAYEDWLLDIVRRADALRPDDGRAGREHGLFCSADMDGLGKWVKSNHGLPGYDHTPTQISYHGPEPFVYPVLKWPGDRATDQDYLEYWQAGIPLQEFYSQRPDLQDPHTWSWGHEVIIDPDHVRSSRKIALKRLILSVSPNLGRDLERAFFPRRVFKGDSWIE